MYSKPYLTIPHSLLGRFLWLICALISTITCEVPATADTKAETCITMLSNIKLSPERKTAVEVARMLIDEGEIPTRRTNYGLQQRWHKYRSSKEFEDELERQLKDAPKARKLYEEKMMTPCQRTAANVVRLVHRKGRIPTWNPKSKIESNLYSAMRRCIADADPTFFSQVARSANAQELIEKATMERHQKTAAALDADFLLTGQIPTESANPRLREKYLQDRVHPKFVESIQSPVLRELVQKDLGIAGLGFTDALYDKVVRHFISHGVSPASAARGSLKEEYLKIKDSPEFQRRLRRNSAVWSLFLQSEQPFSPAEVQHLAREMVRLQRAPTVHDDRGLFDLYYRFKNHPETRSEFLKIEGALSILDSTERPLAELTAMAVVRKVLKTQGPIGTEDELLSSRYKRFKRDPNFIAIVSQHPEVMRIVERQKLSPLERTAEDMISFLRDHGDIPRARSKTETALYQRWSKVRSDPEFEALAQTDPEAWEIYSYAILRAAGKVGRDLRRFVRVNGAMVSKEKDPALYARFLEHHKSAAFAQEIQDDQLSRTMYETWRAESGRKHRSEAVASAKKVRDEISTTVAQEQQLLVEVDAVIDRRRGFLTGTVAQEKNPRERGISDTAEVDTSKFSVLPDGLKTMLDDSRLYNFLKVDRFRWRSVRPFILSEPRFVAREVIEYYRINGSFPIEEVDPMLFESFRRNLSNTEFQATLRTNDPTIHERFMQWLSQR